MIKNIRIRSAIDNSYIIPQISGPVAGGNIGLNNPDTGNASNSNWPPLDQIYNLYTANANSRHQVLIRDQTIWTGIFAAEPTISSVTSDDYTDIPTILYSPYFYSFLGLVPPAFYDPYNNFPALPCANQDISAAGALKIVIKKNTNGYTIHKYEPGTTYGDALYYDDTKPDDPLKFMTINGPSIDNFVWHIETVYSS